MSTTQQAKARRRQMRNGSAHLGNALGKPIYGIRQSKGIHEAIAAERERAAREARAKNKKK